MSVINSDLKVKVLPSAFNSWGGISKGKALSAGSGSSRVEYNAIKLDNSGEKAQALYLTSSVPKDVIPALEKYYQTNYVVDFPGGYQLERVEEKPWDDCRKAYLSLRGTHVATMRWGKEERRDSLRFDIGRCLENDGARIARMVEAVSFVSKQLQTFASCPVNYAAPAPSSVCGKSYGDKTLVQVDTLHLKITEGNTSSLFFDDSKIIRLGEYQLVERGTGGRMFRDKAEIWFQGQQIGSLLWGARMKTHEGFAKLEISNRILYDTTLFTRQLVEGFLSTIEAEVNKIYRVDIAFDSTGLMSFLNAVHRREIVAVRQMTYRKGKKYVSLATDEIEGFYFGSRSAGRFVRCYNKSLELKGSRKKYISDWHELNGIFGTLGRLEFELKSDYLRTVAGLKWHDVFDRAKMAELGEKAMEGWFDWVPSDSTDSKLNRRERVQIVDFSQVKKSGYERQVPEVEESNRTERIMIKQLILRAEAAPTDAAAVELLQTAGTLTEYHDLRAWLLSKEPEFARLIKERAQLEEREIAGRFYGRSWFDVMWEAYEEYQPVSIVDGELATITPIVHYQAA